MFRAAIYFLNNLSRNGIAAQVANRKIVFESRGVTWCNFSCNLNRHVIARKVAREIAACNIASKKNFMNIARQVAGEGVLHDATDAQVAAIVAQSRTMVYFVQRFEQLVSQ